MTPGLAISNARRAGERLTLELALERDLPAVAGHFPGTPILPAVAQVDWAVRFAREHFELPAHFTGLRALKFLRLVQPPVHLTLELTHNPVGRSVAFAYLHGDSPCATGRLEFSDDPPGPRRPLL